MSPRHGDDENVHDFGPLPEDKGTYILSPVHTSIPNSEPTSKPKPHSEPEELRESSVSEKPTAEPEKPVTLPELTENPVTPTELTKKTVTPTEYTEKLTKEKLADAAEDKEKSLQDNSSLNDVLTQSSSDKPSHHMMPLMPVGLAEKIAKRKVEDTNETEGEALRSPPPPVTGDTGTQPASMSPDGSLKPPPPVAPKPKSKSSEPIQSPVSPKTNSGSLKLPATTPVKPQHKGASDRDEEVADGKQTGGTGSRSEVSPTSPAMLTQSTSKTPNRVHGIQLMPVGLAEKLSARRQKMEKDKSTEGTSETLPVVEQESESFFKTASFDDVSFRFLLG